MFHDFTLCARRHLLMHWRNERCAAAHRVATASMRACSLWPPRLRACMQAPVASPILRVISWTTSAGVPAFVALGTTA